MYYRYFSALGFLEITLYLIITIFTFFSLLCQFLSYGRVNQLYIYPLIFRFPSHLGPRRVLSRVPCAAEQVLISYLFYIQCCVYVNFSLSGDCHHSFIASALNPTKLLVYVWPFKMPQYTKLQTRNTATNILAQMHFYIVGRTALG